MIKIIEDKKSNIRELYPEGEYKYFHGDEYPYVYKSDVEVEINYNTAQEIYEAFNYAKDSLDRRPKIYSVKATDTGKYLKVNAKRIYNADNIKDGDIIAVSEFLDDSAVWLIKDKCAYSISPWVIKEDAYCYLDLNKDFPQPVIATRMYVFEEWAEHIFEYA